MALPSVARSMPHALDRGRPGVHALPRGQRVPAVPEQRDELTELVASQQDALMGRAMKLCGDPDRARDLVQDTLERALRKRASFIPGTNVRAWLMTILTNRFLDQLRRKKVVTEVAIVESLDVAEDPPAEELRVTS